MAQRRMFAIKIIDSAKFLKMPASTRLLYYDLGMRADDDGVVEAFNVLRMTGATEDDLKILVAKEYIKVLNEDLVSYITDWRENNQLRADRKIDSMYQDLLLQVIPEVELLESKTRSDRIAKSRKNNGTSQGQPMDSQWTEEYRLGKDSLGEVSIGKVISSSSIELEDEEQLTDSDELKEIMLLCQSLNYKLRKIDAKCFIDAFGGQVVKKAIGIAVNTEVFRNSQIKNYGSYLGTVLKDLNRDKKVDININHQKKGLKFNNYVPRTYENDSYDDFIGWEE